jgi:hypothetical protein
MIWMRQSDSPEIVLISLTTYYGWDSVAGCRGRSADLTSTA